MENLANAARRFHERHERLKNRVHTAWRGTNLTRRKLDCVIFCLQTTRVQH